MKAGRVTEIPLNFRDETERDAVRAQLDRILKSDPFLQSRRRQRFLAYIVNETLAGRGGRIKGYSIAREVFDRSESFDANVDPIVRIEAGRVRDRLREYYEGEGESDPIRIDLPKGAYTPKFEFRQATAQTADSGRPASEMAASEDRPADVALADLEATTAVTPAAAARGSLASFLQHPIAIPAAVMLVLLCAVSAWLYVAPLPPRSLRSAEPPATELPKGPAIAVLPFSNLSGDPKQAYFSDGLTEDILTELSRSRDLRVLARNTTFQYKGQAVDVVKLGRDLRVRYVLEGSVQRAGDRLRVTAQLIDAETGTHIWADRFDRTMADVFLVQDEIVSQIAAKIAGGYGVIETSENRSAASKSANEIEAYDLVLRAHDAMQWEWSRATFGAARESLRQAIALDPMNARAIRELAWLAVVGWIFRFDATPVPPQEITTMAKKAVQLDPADARAHMVAAAAYFFDKQLDLFESEAREAIALAPFDAEILATVGGMIAKSGQWEWGVALVKKANALNADAAVGWYHAVLSADYYLKGDYERALEINRQDPDQQALNVIVQYIRIYGALGRKPEALEYWHKLTAKEPGWTAESFESWSRLWNMRDEDVAKLMDGVYKSGVIANDKGPGK